MPEIAQKLALKRWDILPENLKEAIFSELNSEILWSIGQSKNLPEEKIAIIAKTAGDVLLGFIKPETNIIAQEITERAAISADLAMEIAGELENKIINQFKDELNSFRIYLEKNPATPVPFTGPSFGQKEELKIDSLTPPVSKKKSESMNSASRNLLEAEAEPAGSEFTGASFGQTQGAETPVMSPSAEPFILHEEKPLFTAEKDSEKPSILFQAQAPTKAPAQKPAKARIETPNENDSDSNDVRVVHYSEFRTPLDNKNS